MKKKILIALATILTFLCARYLKYFYGYVVYGKENWNSLDKVFANNLLVYSQIFLVTIVCLLIFRKKIFEYLGIGNGILEGVKYGFICTLPMIIGFGILKGFHVFFDLSMIHRDFIIAGFFEEFLFRGFLFGILFYVAGWGFIPAVLIPSVYFGFGHLYQAENYNEVINVFLFTTIGSAGFAWFYTAWRNLWVVIFLHAFMDLTWDIYQIETNVAGNLWVNIFRFTTLGLMVYFSVRNIKHHPANSIKDKFWINKSL